MRNHAALFEYLINRVRFSPATSLARDHRIDRDVMTFHRDIIMNRRESLTLLAGTALAASTSLLGRGSALAQAQPAPAAAPAAAGPFKLPPLGYDFGIRLVVRRQVELTQMRVPLSGGYFL